MVIKTDTSGDRWVLLRQHSTGTLFVASDQWKESASLGDIEVVARGLPLALALKYKSLGDNR